MSVPVLFFASYADLFGSRRLMVPLEPPCTIAEIVQALRLFPGGERLPGRPLVAVNQVWMLDQQAVVQPDDEVAIIPPVAGG